MKNLLIIFLFLLIQISLISQNSLWTTDSWLDDDTTISFGDSTKFKNCFNGLRFILEPQLGLFLQEGEDRFNLENFKSLERLGLETNLLKGYISLQGIIVYPSVVELDNKSPLRINNNTIDPLGKVNVDIGFSLGLSFLDGMVAVGFGGLFYDKRDFQGVNGENGEFQDNFWYFNIQPVSAIRKGIKFLKK